MSLIDTKHRRLSTGEIGRPVFVTYSESRRIHLMGVEHHVESGECEHAVKAATWSVKAHCLGVIALYEDACSTH
jgi:hypothetical protein